MARAFGSYPKCHWFKSSCRYQHGPVVKRLRHRPFTAVSRVRISSGSPKDALTSGFSEVNGVPYKPGKSGAEAPGNETRQKISVPFIFWHGRIAQLVRALASHARGHGFESPCVHHGEKNRCRAVFFISAGSSSCQKREQQPLGAAAQRLRKVGYFS